MTIDLVEDNALPPKTGEETHASADSEASQQRVRLGEILRAYNLISEDQLQQALEEGRHLGVRLGQALVALKIVSQEKINWALALHLKIPCLTLNAEMVDAALVRRLPEELLRELGVLPLVLVGKELTVAIADPTDQYAIHAIENATSFAVKVAIASTTEISWALDRVFGQQRARQLKTATDIHAALVSDSDHHLEHAYAIAADTIYIRPIEQTAEIVFCAGKRTLETQREKRATYVQLAAQIKQWAALPDNESAFVVTHSERTIHGLPTTITVSRMPSLYGPALTLRILRPQPPVSLTELGLDDATIGRLRPLLWRRSGTMVVCGTDDLCNAQLLYALAQQIPAISNKRLVAIEKTTRIRFDQACQISLDQHNETDLVDVLRHVRQEQPDVLLLSDGDMLHRPEFSALLRSTLANTLLLTSLKIPHAEDALAFMRDLCAPPEIFNSALNGLLGYVLADRICAKCAHPCAADDPALICIQPHISCDADSRLSFQRAAGCDACGNTGTQGQIPVVSLLAIDADVRRHIAQHGINSGFDDIVAANGGFLRQTACRLLDDGIIGVDEACRLVG